ncbi:hypothetical protein [Tsuneonella sp. HG222]
MIQVSKVRLRSITDTREFGADISLSGGLNIIQADNTSGKSTTVQSIIFGLGMEGALSPGRQVPLPYAMREQIEETPDSKYEQVIRSFVMLELRNSKGEVLTVRRDIRGGSDKKLVRTWRRPIDQIPNGEASERDFFLYDPGAAIREDGFHHHLANFIGWELPEVPRFDGAEGILYLETLIPMFFVEQKRGWSTTLGPLPTYLGIQDLSRRVMEFVLDLDAGRTRRRRAELRRELAGIEAHFASRRQDVIDDAGRLVRVAGIPHKPNEDFAAEGVGRLTAFHAGEWMPVEDVVSIMRREITELDQNEIEDVGPKVDQLREDLKAAEKRYAEISGNLALVRQDFDLAVEERNAFQRRVSALEIDLKRNLDAKKLEDLGSTLGTHAATGQCPTCKQGVNSELLPLISVETMGIEENILFVRNQLDLYRSSQGYANDHIDELRVKYQSLNNEIEEARGRIRAIKDDLVRPNSSPTRSRLEEIVRRETLLDRWLDIQERIDAQIDSLREIAEAAAKTRTELNKLGLGGLTLQDRNKVTNLTTALQELLRKFGFSSLKSNEIGLSEDDFRPQVLTRSEDEELQLRDIGFEASASDGIRLKWAYYLAILSLAQSARLNHLGFLVFDEPGQQQMKDIDLHEMLRWSSRHVKSEFQVIVTTSQQRQKVRDAVADSGATIHEIDGFILKPLT